MFNIWMILNFGTVLSFTFICHICCREYWEAYTVGSRHWSTDTLRDPTCRKSHLKVGISAILSESCSTIFLVVRWFVLTLSQGYDSNVKVMVRFAWTILSVYIFIFTILHLAKLLLVTRCVKVKTFKVRDTVVLHGIFLSRSWYPCATVLWSICSQI